MRRHVLLQYVVNVTNESGNMAMHYAVSHGNFDIVSILLDSKVCDINKPNKAGYTSVVLVSLVEVRSRTHASVDGRTALKIAIEAGHRHVGVLLYAYQRNIQGLHDKKKSKPASPKTPSSALPLRSSYFTTK